MWQPPIPLVLVLFFIPFPLIKTILASGRLWAWIVYCKAWRRIWSYGRFKIFRAYQSTEPVQKVAIHSKLFTAYKSQDQPTIVKSIAHVSLKVSILRRTSLSMTLCTKVALVLKGRLWKRHSCLVYFENDTVKSHATHNSWKLWHVRVGNHVVAECLSRSPPSLQEPAFAEKVSMEQNRLRLFTENGGLMSNCYPSIKNGVFFPCDRTLKFGLGDVPLRFTKSAQVSPCAKDGCCRLFIVV